MKKWYAVYVRPRCEKKVAQGFLDTGIEGYLPLVRTLRKWSDRRKLVDIPLIPGYCFVYAEESEHFSILKQLHVVAFVRLNGKTAVIPDDQIEFLQRMLSQSEVGYELSGEMPKPGQMVEIVAGPLIGMRAEVVKANRHSKVFLRLEALNKAIRVEVPPGDVVVVRG